MTAVEPGVILPLSSSSCCEIPDERPRWQIPRALWNEGPEHHCAAARGLVLVAGEVKLRGRPVCDPEPAVFGRVTGAQKVDVGVWRARWVSAP